MMGKKVEIKYIYDSDSGKSYDCKVFIDDICVGPIQKLSFVIDTTMTVPTIDIVLPDINDNSYECSQELKDNIQNTCINAWNVPGVNVSFRKLNDIHLRNGNEKIEISDNVATNNEEVLDE